MITAENVTCPQCGIQSYYKRTLKGDNWSYIYHCEKCKMELVNIVVTVPKKEEHDYAVAIHNTITVKLEKS
jgi:uncharacterized Zn finger protein